jgi:hypothetical protein
MPEYVQVTQADVDALAAKLNELGTKLNDKEATVLMGVLSLADKSLGAKTAPDACAGEAGEAKKKKLVLERETIRNLNVWERLLATQGHSLWTCNGLPDPLGPIVNPARK